MKKKNHSYQQHSRKHRNLSSIIIIILLIILAVLIGNYLLTVSNISSASSDKKSSWLSKLSEKESRTDSQDTESSPNKSSFHGKDPNQSTPTIVIDAGHGGPDPGKVSEAGTLEKDINLKIAMILKELLEAQNIHVIMTRDEDKDLATETTKRKLSDIKERVKLMENSNADAIVSIHQNSYPDANIYGAQCFYPTESEEGKNLASIIQQQIITSTNQTKIREIKDNNDYYLLKHSSTPIVIVECGFLSNPTEEQLLLTDNYQRQIAWAIHLGILKYLNAK